MRDAARAAVAFAAGKTRAELDADQMLQFALVRAVEIIGEAAARLDAATRRRGRLWETTAVRELRAQAFDRARHLVGLRSSREAARPFLLQAINQISINPAEIIGNDS
jgi:hypothetical protein